MFRQNELVALKISFNFAAVICGFLRELEF